MMPGLGVGAPLVVVAAVVSSAIDVIIIIAVVVVIFLGTAALALFNQDHRIADLELVDSKCLLRVSRSTKSTKAQFLARATSKCVTVPIS